MPTASVLGRDLSLSRFTVLDNAAVSDPARLAAALEAVGAVVDDPLLRTRIRETFRLDEIDQALAERLWAPRRSGAKFSSTDFDLPTFSSLRM